MRDQEESDELLHRGHRALSVPRIRALRSLNALVCFVLLSAVQVTEVHVLILQHFLDLQDVRALARSKLKCIAEADHHFDKHLTNMYFKFKITRV